MADNVTPLPAASRPLPLLRACQSCEHGKQGACDAMNPPEMEPFFWAVLKYCGSDRVHWTPKEK